MTIIQYQKGNIFDSKAHVIVNTVNCKGVMGKGLALDFKQRYPAMFTTYQQECRTGKLRIGRPTLYRASTPWILNFPTKNDWRLPSKLEYLEKGLEYVVATYKQDGIKSIAFPKLGAQNGHLSWDDVGPLMAKYLSQLDIDAYVYIAEGDTEYQVQCDKAKDPIWEQFNELARSIERLQHEVGLRPRQATKIAHKRGSIEFTSLSDFDNIEGMSKEVTKKIKAYISHQQYSLVELSDFTSTSNSHRLVTKDATKLPKRKSKKHTAPDQVSVEPLFPTLVS